MREEGGTYRVTAMCIAAGPPGVPLNIAVSAPSLHKQLMVKESGDISQNCPFLQGPGSAMYPCSTYFGLKEIIFM